MVNSTDINLTIVTDDPATIANVENLLGEFGTFDVSQRGTAKAYVLIEVSDFAAEDITQSLHDLVTSGQDFAYTVQAVAADGYPGTLTVHVPGTADFTGGCDADGDVLVTAGALTTALQGTPEQAVAAARALTGTDVIAAFDTLVVTR